MRVRHLTASCVWGCIAVILVLWGALLVSTESTTQSVAPATTSADAAVKARISDTYGRLPLTFEANRGQTDPQVKFLARGSGYTLFLTPTEAVLALTTRGTAAVVPTAAAPKVEQTGKVQHFTLRMQLVGTNRRAPVEGRDELPGKAHYFLGSDPAKWRAHVPTFARVHYTNIYPGIDLTFYGNQRQLEYDFIIGPGAQPTPIALRFEGADQLHIDTKGNLVLSIGGAEIRQRGPSCYQEVDGRRRPISCGYAPRSNREVGFQVAPYEPTRPLIIDPVLVYSTYLGGFGADGGFAVAVDATGSAYVTGETPSSNFPTTTGAFDTTVNGGSDAFVTKLDPSGSALIYSTYLGGGALDRGLGIALDTVGNAHVTGLTFSTSFPTTPGAVDTTLGGNFDAFVTKLDATGATLVYSTYLGGSGDDAGFGIAVDAAHNAHITGLTRSADLPTTAGAFDTTFSGFEDAFVMKLNPTGSAPPVYSTYLGGSSGQNRGHAIAVDVAGSAYVTGMTSSTAFPTTPGAFDPTHNGGFLDAFVTKLDASGSTLVYSTYLGGGGSDEGKGIDVSAAGEAYVTGVADSTNFPTTPAAFDTTFNGAGDAFVTKLSPSGSAPLVYSTYFGGTAFEEGLGLAVDGNGNPYITGRTNSTDLPTTPAAFDTTFNGNFDSFVTQFDSLASATLLYSTYLGGSGAEIGRGITVDPNGNAYVTGDTLSTDFPTTPGAFDTTFTGTIDAFVAKIGEIVEPPATLTLNPPTATNPVETQHCVTATVKDAGGNPAPSVTVRFTVTGSVSTSGSATTDANGQATFCYMGPPLPGADTITAFADTDNDGTQDAAEPMGAAAKTWTLPVTTPLCEIKITNGGRITALNGDKATFGGNAKSSQTGETQGQEQYQDHGPVQPLNVHSINVLSIVCDGPGDEASIYGQATINGAGPFFYRIKVKDLGEPGVGFDKYWILLQTGYTSGEQTLEGGNVQIHKQ